jgi:hypothetical protein
MRFRRFVPLGALVVLMACAGARVRPDLVYEGTYRSYEKIFDNWTRVGRIYHYFSTNAIVSATYFATPMRRAYVSEWGRAFDLPMEERERRLTETTANAAQRLEFVVSFYTPTPRYNDLDQGDSSWRLWFVDGQGTKVEAAKVEPIRVKHEKDTYFYPTYTDWGRLYRVYFPAVGPDNKPLVAESGTVTLRVTGVEGMTDLVWQIPPGNS